MHLDFPVLFLKLLDGLADQVDHFSVGGAALVLRNKVQFIVKLAVNAQPEMLILFLLQRRLIFQISGSKPPPFRR